MKPVKTRILNAALGLFNERGSDEVSIRDVAEKLEMSPGNLCYHYKNTDALIHALYYRLSEISDARFIQQPAGKSSMQSFLEFMRDTYSLMDEYRFIFLDIVRIVRRSPEIHAHYLQLIERRKQQMRAVIALLVTDGFVDESILQEEYAGITDVGVILGDYWLSHAQLTGVNNRPEKIDYYIKINSLPLLPFLTPSGKECYVAFFTAARLQ